MRHVAHVFLLATRLKELRSETTSAPWESTLLKTWDQIDTVGTHNNRYLLS